MKDMLSEIFYGSVVQRRRYILNLLREKGLKPHKQYFSINGIKNCNISVHFKGQIEKCIVVSAHYDGFGAYDNAGGITALLYLIEMLITQRMRHEFLFCFFDCEEKGQLGSKAFLKMFPSREFIAQFLEIDGSGIGDCLVGIANFSELVVQIGNKKVRLPCNADFSSFVNFGIPSIHLFTVPNDEGKLFIRKNIFPETLYILHTEQDNLDRVDDDTNKQAANKLYEIIRDLDASEDYFRSCQLVFFPFT